jgi:hypothetical protein
MNLGTHSSTNMNRKKFWLSFNLTYWLPDSLPPLDIRPNTRLDIQAKHSTNHLPELRQNIKNSDEIPVIFQLKPFYPFILFL